MPERHADQLFSAAYDDELDSIGRRRFDSHIEGCERCADAFDDYRAALDAVHALPAVAMPATVRLPVGAPQPERGRAAFLTGLRAAVFHPQPVWSAGGLAAVALALVILAVHHPGGGTGSAGPSNSSLRGGTAALAPAAPGGLLPNGLSQAQQVPALAPVPCPVSPVPASAQPASFSHTATAPAGSGQQLVLATQQGSYAPGQSVPIYARLTSTSSASSASATDVVPCVTLETVPAANPAPAPAAPPGVANRAAPPAPGQAEAGSGSAAADQAPAYSQPVPPTPLAVATAEPGSFSAAGGEHAPAGGSSKQVASGPLLSVTIPSNIAPGTVLRLVAIIPPHYAGNPTDSPIQVVLLITVR